MNRVDAAASLFKKGYNCTQALLAVYGAESGLDRGTAFKIGSAFGGGIGRMGKTCGAVTGAVMVIGLKYGKTHTYRKVKMKVYMLVKKFVKEFKSRNGSITCRELLGFEMNPDRRISLKATRLIMKKCPRYVEDAAEIIELVTGGK